MQSNKNEVPKNDNSNFNEPEKEDLTNGGVIERKKINKSLTKLGTPMAAKGHAHSHTSTANINIKQV